MPQADAIMEKPAELWTRVRFYDESDDGPQRRKTSGWGCPCFVERDQMSGGFVFLSGERAVAEFRKAGGFYLWEGRFIGYAEVIDPPV